MRESTIDVPRTNECAHHLRHLHNARRSIGRAAAWTLCIFLMYELLAAVHYPLRDPDSRLYELISASLEQRPHVEWLAPMWPPGKAKSGLFVEHLPFFFWPTAILGGWGVARPALLANLVYFLGCLYLLFLIARGLLGHEGAWLTVGLYAISPLGVQYLVRANQENAWALGFLGALYCLREQKRGRAWTLAFVWFAVFAFLIKGVLALALFPALAGLWFWSSRRKEELVCFAAAIGTIAVLCVGYEWTYRRITGETFFENYIAAQMSYVYRDEAISWGRKLLNPIYYAANILWFALPSSLLALYGAYRGRQRREPPTAAQKLTYICSGSYFALALPIARRAARYIFPAYSLIHLPAAQLLCDGAPKLRAWLARRQRYLPYGLMLLLGAVLVARVMVDLHFYRFVQVF